jgi:hypothetical protein
VREILQGGGLQEPGAARAADDRDDEAVAQRRVRLHHPGGGVQQDVGRLERLDAPDEQQQHGIGRDAELGPRECGLTGPEVLEVDARRDGDHPLDLGAVQVDQLARLVVGVRDQAVRGRDHLLLADHPAQRLGASPRERPGSSPWPRCARCAPAARPTARSPASRPVRTASSGSARRRTSRLVHGLGAQHPGGQSAQLRRQVLLRQALERPRP